MSRSPLLIEPDWLSVDGVTSPELAATWCRLSIDIDAQVVTRVDDVLAHTTRNSIFCSAYPLAEWVATHWWALRSHVRPAAFLEAASRVPGAVMNGTALAAHDMRAAGDGFLWPRLLIVPQGRRTFLVWTADESAGSGPIRFASSGHAWASPTDVQSALAGLVNATIDRLVEMGIVGTLLQEEWAAVEDADAEEAAFCDAAAALGLDPYDVPDTIAESILSIGALLDARLATEFTVAADPTRIHEDLNWVASGLKRISHEPSAAPQTLRSLRKLAIDEEDDGPPWEIGWRQARTVRGALKASDTEPIALPGLFEHHHQQSSDPALQALASGIAGRIQIVTGTRKGQAGQRFVEGRALWRDLQCTDRPYLLTTAATYDQRVERAFAAELLAPAAGVAKLIDARSGVVLAQDIEGVARRYKASPVVVAHQVENQLGLSVAA